MSSELRCKVSDFGMSRDTGQSESDYYQSRGGALPIRWCSPEVLEHRKFSPRSDVYAMGILLYEIWTKGASPYSEMKWNNQTVWTMVTSGYRLPCPIGCTEEVYNFMFKCWLENTHERPTANELCNFFRKLGRELDESSNVLKSAGYLEVSDEAELALDNNHSGSVASMVTTMTTETASKPGGAFDVERECSIRSTVSQTAALLQAAMEGKRNTCSNIGTLASDSFAYNQQQVVNSTEKNSKSKPNMLAPGHFSLLALNKNKSSVATAATGITLVLQENMRVTAPVAPVQKGKKNKSKKKHSAGDSSIALTNPSEKQNDYLQAAYAYEYQEPELSSMPSFAELEAMQYYYKEQFDALSPLDGGAGSQIVPNIIVEEPKVITETNLDTSTLQFQSTLSPSAMATLQEAVRRATNPVAAFSGPVVNMTAQNMSEEYDEMTLVVGK